MNIVYKTNSVTEEKVYTHLKQCNEYFIPPLSSRINLHDFSQKIFARAVKFEAWYEQKLVGLVSAYFNDTVNHLGYINNVSVIKEFTGKGIGSALFCMCIEYARVRNFAEINLEVARDNTGAIKLYKKFGFNEFGDSGDFVFMKYKVDNVREKA